MNRVSYFTARYGVDALRSGVMFSMIMGGTYGGLYYMETYDQRQIPKFIMRMNKNNPFVAEMAYTSLVASKYTAAVCTGSVVSAILTPLSVPFWVWIVLR